MIVILFNVISQSVIIKEISSYLVSKSLILTEDFKNITLNVVALKNYSFYEK